MTALFIAMLAASPELLDLEPLELSVAVVRDPELPPLEPKLVTVALEQAKAEFQVRFDTKPPRFVLAAELSLADFLSKHADERNPACRDLFESRYRGGGAAELAEMKHEALEFFGKWSLESLTGFIAEKDRAAVHSYEDIWKHYVSHYTAGVEAMKHLETSASTPLLDPARSTLRSFAAWTCALKTQTDYDVVVTNAFILADLKDEPHPHAVFGKLKVGGIATESPGRSALGRQALLATTFGIDTPLAEFRELPGAPASFDERAKILGAYLLAHEIAHAVFGIPDVFDHPKGCLMTSRPGTTYREGLAELEANRRPCARCRPYVEARSLGDRAARAVALQDFARAHDLVAQALKKLPRQIHGGRKKRVADLLRLAARASQGMGRRAQAKRYEELALKVGGPWPPARTSSTATTARSGLGP